MTDPKFIRLLNLLHAIRDLSPFNALSADEAALLDDLVVRWHRKAEIAVSELMGDKRHGSQSTAYRRLMGLKDKGMVSLRVDEADRRVKFVEPTDLARDYIRRINQSVRSLEI